MPVQVEEQGKKAFVLRGFHATGSRVQTPRAEQERHAAGKPVIGGNAAEKIAMPAVAENIDVRDFFCLPGFQGLWKPVLDARSHVISLVLSRIHRLDAGCFLRCQERHEKIRAAKPQVSGLIRPQIKGRLKAIGQVGRGSDGTRADHAILLQTVFLLEIQGSLLCLGIKHPVNRP